MAIFEDITENNSRKLTHSIFSIIDFCRISRSSQQSVLVCFWAVLHRLIRNRMCATRIVVAYT